MSSVESMMNCDDESISHCQQNAEDFLHIPMVVGLLNSVLGECLETFFCFQLYFNNLCCFLVFAITELKVWQILFVEKSTYCFRFCQDELVQRKKTYHLLQGWSVPISSEPMFIFMLVFLRVHSAPYGLDIG